MEEKNNFPSDGPNLHNKSFRQQKIRPKSVDFFVQTFAPIHENERTQLNLAPSEFEPANLESHNLEQPTFELSIGAPRKSIERVTHVIKVE